jgi:hypothetical protein
MAMHPIQKYLLHAIALFETGDESSQKKACTIIQFCSRSLPAHSIADIVYRDFVGWLKSSYEQTNPDSLLQYRQELTGQSTRLFHAHVSRNYGSMMADKDILLCTRLLEFVEYLATFQYPHDPHELSQKEQEYQAYRESVSDAIFSFPSVKHEFDEKVYHFILRICHNMILSINPFTYPSPQQGILHHQGPEMTLIGDLLVDGQERYPSADQDLAWIKNALGAIQGKTWICFKWQIFPENIMLIVT